MKKDGGGGCWKRHSQLYWLDIFKIMMLCIYPNMMVTVIVATLSLYWFDEQLDIRGQVGSLRRYQDPYMGELLVPGSSIIHTVDGITQL